MNKIKELKEKYNHSSQSTTLLDEELIDSVEEAEVKQDMPLVVKANA